MRMDDLDSLEKATPKKKGNIDNDDEEDAEEAEEDGDKKPSDAQPKWYDVERHVARSIRAWQGTVAKTVDAASDCMLRAKACIAEFIGTADEDRFKSEINIVRSRMSALEAGVRCAHARTHVHTHKRPGTCRVVWSRIAPARVHVHTHGGIGGGKRFRVAERGREGQAGRVQE
jgi:hypothetical protein